MVDQILVIDKGLKTPSDKVQLSEGKRKEKQEGIAFTVHWRTSSLGAGICEVPSAQMQT